eukprot:7381214-Prymnesium_polylepis.1
MPTSSTCMRRSTSCRPTAPNRTSSTPSCVTSCSTPRTRPTERLRRRPSSELLLEFENAKLTLLTSPPPSHSHQPYPAPTSLWQVPRGAVCGRLAEVARPQAGARQQARLAGWRQQLRQVGDGAHRHHRSRRHQRSPRRV